MSLTKIGSIGINTGIQLAGVTTVSTLHVGSGVTLSSDGDGFFTGITSFTRNFTGDYAVKISNTHATGQGLNIRGGSTNGHYALLVEDYAAANLFEVNGDGEVEVKANHLRANHGVVVTGIVTAASFAGSGANLTGIDTDLVSDTSPQLGGNLDVNTKNIVFGDSGGATDDRLTFGAGTDLSIYHGSNISTINDSYGDLRIMSDTLRLQRQAGGENFLYATEGGKVSLYYDGSEKLETTSTGVSITGKLETTTFISVAADNQDLKVGAGDDLKLFHDGTDSFIHGRAGTRYLKIRAAETRMVNEANSEIVARFIEDGAVELYYDSVKTFHTKQNGVVVEGTEGAGAILEMRADEGDDNADYFRLYDDSGFLSFQDYGAGSWTTLLSLQQQNQVRLYYNGSEKLNTTSGGVSITGKIYMNNGNLQFGTNGNGIDFSATSDASGMSSELLDDYEEGTFEPHFLVAGSESGVSYSSRAGTYTKIGRAVIVNVMFELTNNGSNSGQINIGNLPYTVGDTLANTSHEASGAVGYMVNFGVNVYMLSVSALHGSTQLMLMGQESHDTGFGHIQRSQTSNTFSMRASITYFTA